MALETEVADAQLRRFVVRIDTPDGAATRGSGVLVAPGWVLTCAHVVDGFSSVRVVPDRGAAVGGGSPPAYVTAPVRARSAARDRAAGSAFWPFPDLALLELDGWSGHVIAPLATDEPSRAGEPHAWGYGRREAGVAAVGSPASFAYVGADGDGYLSLKAGDATPGLSGGPLVCLRRRAVVGVMSVSRDPRDARGGWAAPVAALTGGDGVPVELAALGRRILAENQQAAWRYRDDWHRVLPVAGASDVVDRPWEGAVVEPASGQPLTLLRAEFAVVPYLFRGGDLAGVRDWCDAPDRMSVRYLDAAGGTGKTRFALQACRAMAASGWVAGLLPAADRRADGLALPRLLVVDYVEERDAAALAERVAALVRSASPLAPVRLLLLSRPATGRATGQALEPLLGAASGAALTALAAAADTSAAAAGLAVPERADLFDAARSAFDRTWHGAEAVAPSGGPGPDRPDLSGDRYARPLDVLFEAFDAVLSGPTWQPGGRPGVDRALDHEAKHWRTRIPDLDPGVLAQCVALATLAGARDEAEADALFDLVPELTGTAAVGTRRRLDSWLRGLYAGPVRWNPLRPDRLGEALVARVLHGQDDSGSTLLASVLTLSSDGQLERALDVLVRLAPTPAMDAAATAVTKRYTGLVGRCAEQARGTVDRPGRTGLLDAVARAHTALLTDAHVADLPIPLQTDLSADADILGVLARNHGRARDAQAIFATTLAIDQRRHDHDPADPALQRNLTISLERLADLARDAGQTADAENLHRRALQIREQLTEREPDNTAYQRDLAVSCDRLADLATDAGRTTDAENLYRRALQIREQLTEREPDNTTYQRDLSISYERLADLATDAGRTTDAENLYRRALQIREQLTEREPDNTTYQRDLSISYERLADLATDAGRTTDAENLYRRALQITERLTEREPDNTTYQRDLSVSFNKLADLARDAGRTTDAEDLYRRALQIREQLTEREPDNTTYQRDLSVSYDRLGDLATTAGRTTDAEDLHRRGLQIAEQLAEREPDNTTYQRDLAISYEQLAAIAVGVGQVTDARRRLEFAADVRRSLLRRMPHRVDLAVGLATTLDQLAHVTDDPDELRREAAAVLTPFEQAGTLSPRGVDMLGWARDTE